MFPFLNAEHRKALAEIAKENGLPVARFADRMAGKPTEVYRHRIKTAAEYIPLIEGGEEDEPSSYSSSANHPRKGDSGSGDANMLFQLKLPPSTHPQLELELASAQQQKAGKGGTSNVGMKKKKKIFSEKKTESPQKAPTDKEKQSKGKEH
jgi:hypothetical protein